MARATADSVRAVLAPGGDYDLDRNPDLTPFITASALLVARVEECAADKDYVLTEDELTAIEDWLAAHFYVVSDQTYASKSTDGASASFHGQTGMYLDSSRYGQTAKVIDTSGCLSTLVETAQAQVQRKSAIYWLGKPPSDQLDYVERD